MDEIFKTFKTTYHSCTQFQHYHVAS